MKPVFVDQLPMWLSFGFTMIGVIFSILLARLAYGGVLFTFTLLLTAGILVFGFHHLTELVREESVLVSEGLEVATSLIFLAATIYLGYRLRKIIYGR